MAHRQICAMKRCPEKTHSRLRDKNSGKRVDLCIAHAILTKKHYGDNVEVTEQWGSLKVFDDTGDIVWDNVHMETKEEAESKTQAESVQDIVKGAMENARS